MNAAPKNGEEKPRAKLPRFTAAAGFTTTQQRSDLMRKIRSENTKPEVALRKAIWHFGFRYRCHVKNLPGKPDLVFAKLKTVIFVDGDFWHGFDWENKKLKIRSNRDFWIPKIERNIERDAEVNEKLERAGWQVVRVWEHDLKKDFGPTAIRLLSILGRAAGHIEFLVD